MKIPVLYAVLVLALAGCMPLASGLGEPGLEFYPSQITRDSAFIAVADPQPEPGEVIRVEWSIPSAWMPAGLGLEGRMGLFPKEGGQWICWFSNTESSSTCGPSPFIVKTSEEHNWQIKLIAVNQDNERSEVVYSTPDDFTVGGIDLAPVIEIIYPNDGIVRVKVCPKTKSTPQSGVDVDSVDYTAYHTNMTQFSTGSIEYDPDPSCHRGNISLGSGDYFITFTADQSGGDDFGGTVINVTMPAPEPSDDGGSDGDNGETGGYVIEAGDIEKSIIFESADQEYSNYVNIENTGENNLTNLTAEMDEMFTDYIIVSIDDPELLEPGQTTKLRYTLMPGEQGLYAYTNATISANISEGGISDLPEDAEAEKVGEVFVSVAISVFGSGAADPCEGQADGDACMGGTGICVLETCVVGADCLDSEDCTGSQVCQALVCSDAGGCPTGYTCYEGTTSAACTGLTIPYSPLRECDFTEAGGDGVCCMEVECIEDVDCTGTETYCVGYSCVECRTDDDCEQSMGSNYKCSVNSECVEKTAVTCDTGDCYSDCPAGYMSTGSLCDLDPDGDPEARDGVCCVVSGDGDEEGEGDMMPLIFIVAIIAIIGIGAYYYLKKYKSKGGRKGRSKEEEDLEKELEEEF